MKRFLWACGLLMFSGSAFAQWAMLRLPKAPISEAFRLYHTIQVLDTRADANMTESQGAMIIQPSLQAQLASYASSSADASYLLLLHLRRMNYWQVSGLFKGSAYCRYVADYYAQNSTDTGYRLLRKIDTVFAIEKTKGDALDEVMTLTGNGIVATLYPYLTQKEALPNTPLLTLNDIKNTDSFEKEKTPFYALSNLKDGVYWSDTSLYLQQGYDSLNGGSVKTKEDILRRYEFWDKKRGEWIYGSIRRPFMIVYQGAPYIYYQDGNSWSYIKMEKRGQDYFFYTKAPQQSNAAAMGAMYGAVGALMTSALESALNSETGKLLYRFDYQLRRAVLVKQPAVPKTKK